MLLRRGSTGRLRRGGVGLRGRLRPGLRFRGGFGRGRRDSSTQATASGSPLPQPTATRPVKPPTEPTSKASATGPGGQPCKDLPAGYSAYARLTRAWTSGGRHLLALTFEECTFTPLDRQGVHYTPVGGRRTLTVRPDAVVQVLRNGTQLAPVPFAHFSVSAMGRPYYYVRLDASGAVAGIQQIYHP
ncbi:hypothetical protein ACFQZC_14340 [Streptacidiphilus monticola]